MSIERIGLLIGLASALLLAAESVIYRFGRVEQAMAKWARVTANPRRFWPLVARYWRAIAMVFFVIGYIYVLGSTDPDEPYMIEYRPAMISGFVFGLFSAFIDPGPAEQGTRIHGLRRTLMFVTGIIAAVCLSPLWLTGGILGGIFAVIAAIAYFVLLPGFVAIYGAFELKRRKKTKGALSVVGLVLLFVSFLIQFVATP